MPTVGYRLAEPNGRRMLPAKLASLGISGTDVGRLQQQGWLVLTHFSSATPAVTASGSPTRLQRFSLSGWSWLVISTRSPVPHRQ
jgi:ribonuclease Z